MKKVLGLVSMFILACFAVEVGCAPASNDAVGNDPSPDAGGDIDGGDAGTDAPESPAAPLHKVTGARDDERITGVYCPSTAGCVVTTTALGSQSRVLAIDATTVKSEPLVVVDEALEQVAGSVGIDFVGLSRVDDKLIANMKDGSHAFVSATGDPLLKASWSATKVGTVVTSGEMFALNQQYGYAFDGTTWIHARRSFVYNATTAPGPTTDWSVTWSPGGNPEYPLTPTKLEDLHAGDTTICTSEVGYNINPDPVQALYMHPDGSIIIYPSNALSHRRNDNVALGGYHADESGVCISTDGGKMFHLAKLNLPTEPDEILGPNALVCTTKDHCVVAGGQTNIDDSVYVYVSNTASQGATSTWTRSTIPTVASNLTLPSQIFFAPDGQHGWLVGSSDNESMLWTTSDGGATWTDATSSVKGLADNNRLSSGYALDATHIVIGGEKGVILSTF